MKIKIVKCSYKHLWYNSYIGQTFEVLDSDQEDYHVTDPSDGSAGCVLLEDAEVVQEPLELKLNFEHMSVESLQDLIVVAQAYIAERNKPKPFGKEDYERIVAELRACKGRKKFVDSEINNCIAVESGRCYKDHWFSMEAGLWQIYFYSKEEAQAAIDKVGAENIVKAVEYEGSIVVSQQYVVVRISKKLKAFICSDWNYKKSFDTFGEATQLMHLLRSKNPKSQYSVVSIDRD